MMAAPMSHFRALDELLSWSDEHCNQRALYARLWGMADKSGHVGEISLHEMAEGNSRVQMRLSRALLGLEDLGAVVVHRRKGLPPSVDLVEVAEWGGDE